MFFFSLFLSGQISYHYYHILIDDGKIVCLKICWWLIISNNNDVMVSLVAFFLVSWCRLTTSCRQSIYLSARHLIIIQWKKNDGFLIILGFDKKNPQNRKFCSTPFFDGHLITIKLSIHLYKMHIHNYTDCLMVKHDNFWMLLLKMISNLSPFTFDNFTWY